MVRGTVFYVRYGMAGFRYRLVCGTFFSYGPRLVRGTVFFWCVVRYAFCMVLYGQVNRGCCYWVYKVCGHTDRQTNLPLPKKKGCGRLVYKGCGQTDTGGLVLQTANK